MSVKKRVFQVAREFNVSNEALIAFLTKLNYDIRNQMSPITEEAYTAVIEKFGEKAGDLDQEVEFRKRLREKKAIEETKKREAQEDLERRLRTAREIAREFPALKKKREAEKEEIPTGKSEEEIAHAIEKAKEIVKPAAKPKVTEPTKAKAEPIIEEKLKKPKKKLKVVEIPSGEGVKRPKVEKIKAEEPVGKEKEAEKKGVPEKPKTIGLKPGELEAKKKRRRRRRKKRAAPELQEQRVAVVDKKKKKAKKKKKIVFDELEIQESIRQTMATMEETGKGRRRKRRVHAEEEAEIEITPKIKVSEFMSISELSKLIDVEPSELIKKCMDLGMMVSINQRLDMDSITLLASEYGYEVEALSEFGADLLESLEIDEDLDDNLAPRPPVVTIMGHVDHGKTSLLDQIRKSNIIAGEAGGITQHIGAYEVSIDGKYITFLDTPGHEAFTAMRARGAQVTDIVVLVVAADDNVMPQTIEAISHAKAAGVSIIVAINKIDKPGANPENIRTQLSSNGVLVEQWGGKYQSVELSAKTGQNVEQLLEMILLEAEVLDLKANYIRNAMGVIIESELDRGKGVVATVLVQQGTLSIGEPFVAGAYSGKVRSMFDERGKRVKSAGPSVPVQVLGFDGIPQAGDSFIVLESERDTKEISQKRQQLQREVERWRNRPRTLDEISRQIQKGQIKQLFLVMKADVDGSIEAITDALLKLSTEEVGVEMIHRGVGAISESDVLLASASGAIVIGFNVRLTIKARDLAAKEEVDIRQYEVIYDIVSDIKSALEGFLAPTISEELSASIEIRQVFKVPKVGNVAGCYVTNGKIKRNDKVKLYRDDRLIYDGEVETLKRFKDDVKEVASGFECGISIKNFTDIKVNDIIEGYKVIETKRKLE